MTSTIFQTPEIGREEQAALDQIEELRRQLRYSIAEPRRWLGSVRRVLAARAIQGSNSIEGYNVSVEDAVAAIEGDHPSEATDLNWLAVTGYRRAMTYVLQLAQDDHFEYSDHVLRSLQFMMTEYDLASSPGLWRPGAIWIRNDVTGEVVYEAPDHDQVPGLIKALTASLAGSDDSPAIVKASMAHLNLVMIHPFRDGNGRMARCLQTLVLAREGILAPEFCSIEEYLGVNTETYYQVLQQVGQGAWHPENDARPWIRFCLEAHYVQAASVLRRVRESEAIWSALESLIREHRLFERTLAALFDAAIGMKVRNASYRSLLDDWGEGISKQTASTDLRSMVDAGLLIPKGKKRGAFYVASDALEQIRTRARSGRTPIDTASLFSPAP